MSFAKRILLFLVTNLLVMAMIFLVLGILAALALMAFQGAGLETWPARLETATWCFVIPALSAYLAMNFTGASTYTSLSGVKKEMRRAVPLQIGAGILGLALWLGSHFVS